MNKQIYFKFNYKLIKNDYIYKGINLCSEYIYTLINSGEGISGEPVESLSIDRAMKQEVSKRGNINFGYAL